LAVFHQTVVLEKGDIVGRGLDPQHKAGLVIPVFNSENVSIR